MRPRVGDGEAERDEVEERRIGRFDALAAKIVAGVEDEFELAGASLARADERFVGAPIGVGRDVGDERASPRLVDLVKLHPYPLGRPAARQVEDVGRQAGQIILRRGRAASPYRGRPAAATAPMVHASPTWQRRGSA